MQLALVPPMHPEPLVMTATPLPDITQLLGKILPRKGYPKPPKISLLDNIKNATFVDELDALYLEAQALFRHKAMIPKTWRRIQVAYDIKCAELKEKQDRNAVTTTAPCSEQTEAPVVSGLS